MKQVKTGTLLIVIGNFLYLAFTFFSKNEISSFGQFSSGILLGLPIGCNFIGIILMTAYISKNNKKNK